ncbi:hypothetical protein FSY75_33575 [Streptomyces sp. TR1341]|uniref:hypothetical protein n=1 Tax=Streptomyces sp. TR1341 TaxID=2601266 RepID=UPI00138ABC8F|nr:hypothetical protein [Streptomyces sp. TR1341]
MIYKRHEATTPVTGRPRLLPWSNLDGNPCYVVTDDSGTQSALPHGRRRRSRSARHADDLLGHAVDLLGDRKATAPQLRFLAARLAESLHDVYRIARSRGARLSLPGDRRPPEKAPGT